MSYDLSNRVICDDREWPWRSLGWCKAYKWNSFVQHSARFQLTQRVARFLNLATAVLLVSDWVVLNNRRWRVYWHAVYILAPRGNRESNVLTDHVHWFADADAEFTGKGYTGNYMDWSVYSHNCLLVLYLLAGLWCIAGFAPDTPCTMDSSRHPPSSNTQPIGYNTVGDYSLRTTTHRRQSL